MELKSLLYLGILFLDLLFIVIVIFFERKNPTSTMAWVLILVFLPMLGFIAYLFLGTSYRLNKKKEFATKGFYDKLYNQSITKLLLVKATPPEDKIFKNQVRLFNYLCDEGDGVYTNDNDIKIYTHGKELFKDMLDDMRNAKKHIHLSYYIFRTDRLGKEIIDILVEKAKAGVEVRIIFDSLGSLLSVGSIFKKLEKAGGEAVAFSSVFIFTSQIRINHRNHRKITVIDGLIGYIGGMNIGVEYMGEHKTLHPWRDTHLRFTGSAVNFLQERFIVDWCYVCKTAALGSFETEKYFVKPKKIGKIGLQIINGGPDILENPIRNGFLEMIYSARKTVYIQTPYFVPDESLFDALTIAAKAEIDVRLMLPGLIDHWLVFQASKGYAWEAALKGIKIYQYKGFLHSKTIVCDSLVASIGSTNFNHRSFMHDFEINGFIYNENFAKKCEEIFLEDQKNCIQLDENWFERKHFLTKRIYNFTRLFGPIM